MSLLQLIKVAFTFERHLREGLDWSAKGPKRPDPATVKTDPEYWQEYKEWYCYYNLMVDQMLATSQPCERYSLSQDRNY